MDAAAPRRREAALYPAVKRHLEGLGYQVKGEVCGCDAVGVRPGQDGTTALVIAELKLGLSLDLVLQAVDRMRCADTVWLAVPATRRGRDRDARAHRLCRLLGLGLLAVRPRGGVEVLAEPGPYRPRPSPRRRQALLREHAARRGDPTPGGGRGEPVMTAYRQRALALAAALAIGPGSPRSLVHLAPDAGSILLRDVYGWFVRVERGIYGLSAGGTAALQRWPAEAPG